MAMTAEHREPSYLKLFKKGELTTRVRQAAELLKDCRLCPRECRVDRLGGETGFCRTGIRAGVASFHPHFGEEAPLVGSAGSGTIFFSSCNLLCSFCQNYEISHLSEGKEVDPSGLASMMIDLMRRGCHNINFVTPSHVVPQILQALAIAVDKGLNIPLVYNTGGYDCEDTLKILDGIFDIYMPDFKFWDESWSVRFCRAPDYRARAMTAIREMHRQVGDLIIDEAGVAVRGLLVRHLVLPNGIANTAGIMTFLKETISPDTYVNVMAQYRPCGKAVSDSMINRRITPAEYAAAVRETLAAGLHRIDR